MLESAEGTLKRIVSVRLAPGDDLLKGMEDACKKHGIKNGVILSGIGSLRSALFFTPVVLPDTKAGYGYSTPLEMAGPIELISVSGAVCEGSDGKPSLHVHCCFGDSEGNTRAGHLIEGNPVLLTADICIGEYEGIRVMRSMDDELGVPIAHPIQFQCV